MKKILKSKKFYAICCVLFLATIIGLLINQRISFAEFPKDILYDHSNEANQVLYLSDIPYSKGEVEWGNIALDKTQTNTPLTLMSNGAATVFEKGIWAHATSTIEFDISKYNNFDYFTTYYGLNTTANNVGNGVKFYVYTSVDGNEWTLKTEENPPAIKSANNAVRLKIDIRGANYLKLYAYNNGSNASDHAVWADAKLITEDYIENYMFPVEEYDALIKNYYSSGPVKDELKLTLLQRNFIKNVGQKPLGAFLKADPKNKEMLEWFLNDEEALRLWTIGGRPSGTYEKSLQVLSNLYHTYKDDLSNENLTANGTKYKDLYLKMMLSLSLSHAANVGLWIGGNQFSDAVARYDIYKQMHLNNKLASNAMFESYTIDEMRGVMATNIDDEEILWLRDYSLKRYPDASQRFMPSKYVTYTLNYGYHRPKYYSQANYAAWDAKYNLSAYNITYQAGKPKLWIVFEEGAVCGGISKTAANLYGVWGYPARVVGQPGHAAYIYLYNAGGGRYAWQLSYNVAATAWANTGGSAVNGWGTRYATNSNGIQSGSYILLGQEAQNEYEKYEKASLILLQADIYKNDRQKLEQIYRDALAEERIHLDAWIGLTDLYLTDETKTDEDLYNLALEITEVYAYHPLPMFDSTRRIAVKLKSSPAYYSKLMTLQDATLKKAAKATSTDTIYSKEVPVIANALLGIVDSRIATFSFDGANAGKIVLNKQLQSAQTSWSYSLDGGNTWKDIDDSFAQLTEEELESVNPTNDIKVHITGLPKTPDNIYTIDIMQGVFPSKSVTIDDFENRFNGTNSKMEWTTDLNGEWQAFSDATPLFKGDVVVYVRMIATGVYTTTSPVHYTFTTNASSLTNRFIPRAKISVKAAAVHGKYSFSNMLDGNINTAWFSKESSIGQSFQQANVILELDEPRYVSELDYIPFANATTSLGGYPTGKAKAITVQVSDDYKNWTTVATVNNLANDSTVKKITFTEVKLAKYVSIKFTEINAPALTSFVSVAVLNLYENPTVSEIPLAEVSYNISKKTNKDVVAELVNENREITVTNNNGEKTHTFTENGEFTFEFVDNNGKKGTATAKVDWIDKTPPKAEVTFSTEELTNENVVATVTFDKPNVTILSQDIELVENPVDGSKTITFLENESIEMKFQDELGNIGTKTITVDWIDLDAPTAEFEFNTTSLTDEPVVATLVPSEEVTITNNDGKNTYTFEDNGEFTFEFVDRAGNEGTATANVFWIASLPEYEISYSTKELTNKDVVVTLTIEDGYKLMNNNGNNVYTFTENGTFSFKYIDNYGNVGYIPVTVDWIDKEVTGTIEYNITTLTDQNVIATLKTNKPVTVTNNDGKDTYTFESNGEFTFEFVDGLGNTGSATAKVDWIDKNAVIATITYDIETLTKEDVTATISFNKDGVSITNNDGKNTYTFTSNDKFSFEYIDANGNFGIAEASVTWIDKEPPTAKLEYESADNKIIVKVIEPNEEIRYKEGNGIYEFTKNGNYEIIIYDLVGNETKLIAVIEGLKNESQGGNGGGSTNPGDNDNKPDDNNPDKPNEGDKPTNPDNPGTDNPNNGNNNPDEKPGTGDNQGNKPNVDPGNNNNPGTSTDTPNDNPNEDKEYQKYSIKNITVKIPPNYIKEEATLKSDTFSINNELKTFFGELSEYYDISLVNNKSESISLNGATSITITIKLNEDKQFIGVYKITDDNNIELLDYNKNGQNIEISDSDLGKYVVSYKEKNNSSTQNPNKQTPTNKVNNYKLIFSIISCAVVVLGIFTFALKTKQPK